MFRVAAGQGTLRVQSNGPTDTLGRLLDAEGAQLATNDDSGEGLDFLIETQVAAGVHYVEVRGSSITAEFILVYASVDCSRWMVRRSLDGCRATLPRTVVRIG